MKFDLVEATLNYLSGTKLFEMASDLKDSKRAIAVLSRHITDHLVKILYFGPNHRDFNHWCGEVNGALKNYRFKTFNNKYPSVKQYSEWFFSGNYDIDQEYIDIIKYGIASDYNVHVDYDSNEMLDKVKDIMLKCFTDLSSGKIPQIGKHL